MKVQQKKFSKEMLIEDLDRMIDLAKRLEDKKPLTQKEMRLYFKAMIQGLSIIYISILEGVEHIEASKQHLDGLYR